MVMKLDKQMIEVLMYPKKYPTQKKHIFIVSKIPKPYIYWT